MHQMEHLQRDCAIHSGRSRVATLVCVLKAPHSQRRINGWGRTKKEVAPNPGTVASVLVK
jgi:hypothetical protein